MITEAKIAKRQYDQNFTRVEEDSMEEDDDESILISRKPDSQNETIND